MSVRGRILAGLGAALLLAVLLQVLLPAGHGEHALPWWHETTGFFGVYGVLVCVALVLVAKRLGRLGLQAPEPDPADEAAADLDPAALASPDRRPSRPACRVEPFP